LAADLDDVQRKATHAFSVGHILQTAQDGAQITGDRRLQCQQLERVILGLTLHHAHLLTPRDDLLGLPQIGVQQRLGRLLHSSARNGRTSRRDWRPKCRAVLEALEAELADIETMLPALKQRWSSATKRPRTAEDATRAAGIANTPLDAST
jgi:hypothetical protein